MAGREVRARDGVARICDQQFWFSPIYIYIIVNVIPHCKFQDWSIELASFLFFHKFKGFPDCCFCPLLVSLSKFIKRVVLYLALWLPVWLPRLLPTGWQPDGNRTVPWPLVLRLLASAE